MTPLPGRGAGVTAVLMKQKRAVPAPASERLIRIKSLSARRMIFPHSLYHKKRDACQDASLVVQKNAAAARSAAQQVQAQEPRAVTGSQPCACMRASRSLI